MGQLIINFKNKKDIKIPKSLNSLRKKGFLNAHYSVKELKSLIEKDYKLFELNQISNAKFNR